MRRRSGCKTSGCKQPRRQKSYLQRNLVVETSGKVYLEQNLTRDLILRSVRPRLVKNHAKSAKKEIFRPKFSPKKFFRRRKKKCSESSKTHFGKLRAELSFVWRVISRSSKFTNIFEVENLFFYFLEATGGIFASIHTHLFGWLYASVNNTS